MGGHYEVLSSGGLEGRYGTLVAAGRVVNLPPFVPRPWRTTPYWVICAVTEGTGRYESPERPKLPVEAPAVIIVPPHATHWYGTDGSAWTETWAIFDGPLFDLLSDDADRTNGTVRPLPDSSPTTRLNQILGSSESGEGQVVALFGWLSELVPRRSDGLSPLVRDAAERLGRDLAEPLAMPEVAAQLGLGYDAFRRRFTAETGTAPLAYRTERRVRAAANLLRTTELTTRAIARAVGFSDEFHLARRFRGLTGQTPSGYRRHPPSHGAGEQTGRAG